MTDDVFPECPHCGSLNVECHNMAKEPLKRYEWICLDCGEQWDWRLQDTK